MPSSHAADTKLEGLSCQGGSGPLQLLVQTCFGGVGGRTCFSLVVGWVAVGEHLTSSGQEFIDDHGRKEPEKGTIELPANFTRVRCLRGFGGFAFIWLVVTCMDSLVAICLNVQVVRSLLDDCPLQALQDPMKAP